MSHELALIAKYQKIEAELHDLAWGNQTEIDRVNVRLSEIKVDIVSIMGLGWFEDNV